MNLVDLMRLLCLFCWFMFRDFMGLVSLNGKSVYQFYMGVFGEVFEVLN